MTIIKPKLLKKAIKGSMGVYSIVAKRLNVERATLHQYMARHPELQEWFIEEQEASLDFAESKLWEKINDKDKHSIQFFLERKGKNRGWIQKTETDIKINPQDKEREEIKKLMEEMKKDDN